MLPLSSSCGGLLSGTLTIGTCKRRFLIAYVTEGKVLGRNWDGQTYLVTERFEGEGRERQSVTEKYWNGIVTDGHVLGRKWGP